MVMPDLVVCSPLVNRPVRTRMPWWCGDWGLKTPGYPIRRSLLQLGLHAVRANLPVCSSTTLMMP
jgi:hypothetical protein